MAIRRERLWQGHVLRSTSRYLPQPVTRQQPNNEQRVRRHQDLDGRIRQCERMGSVKILVCLVSVPPVELFWLLLGAE